jgi:hypothetical protein
MAWKLTDETSFFCVPFVYEIAVFPMGFLEVQTPPVFQFMGSDIHISFGFAFGFCQYCHWYGL